MPKNIRYSSFTLRLTCYALIFVPVISGFLYVREFGVNVVFDDAWSTAALFKRWSSGNLVVSDFFRPLNEHIMPVPKLVSFILGIITEYNNVVEMYLIQTCFAATVVVFLLAFRRDVKPWLLLFVPVPILIFSFKQHVNMLFGFQINFAFTQIFGVLTLFLLHISQTSDRRVFVFVVAFASATVASFSTVQAILIWPVGLLQIFIASFDRSVKQIFLAVWGTIGLTIWIVYFFASPQLRGGSTPSISLDRTAEMSRYFLNLLGNSLFWHPDLALTGGTVLVAFALAVIFFVWRDSKLAENSFFVATAAYAFMILAAVTVGRSELGASQAFANRYTTFSLLAVASIYAILTKVVFDRSTRMRITVYASMLMLILILSAISFTNGIEAGQERESAMLEAAEVLASYETRTNFELSENLAVSPQNVRSRAQSLEKLGYNVFSAPTNSP